MTGIASPFSVVASLFTRYGFDAHLSRWIDSCDSVSVLTQRSIGSEVGPPTCIRFLMIIVIVRVMLLHGFLAER